MVTLVLEPHSANVAGEMADHPTHNRHRADPRQPGSGLGNFSAAGASGTLWFLFSLADASKDLGFGFPRCGASSRDCKRRLAEAVLSMTLCRVHYVLANAARNLRGGRQDKANNVSESLVLGQPSTLVLLWQGLCVLSLV